MKVLTEQIMDVIGQHHVRIGVMASPGHWAYHAESGQWFAMCSTDPRADEVGCGWTSEPHTYPDRKAAWAAAHAHVAEQVEAVLP